MILVIAILGLKLTLVIVTLFNHPLDDLISLHFTEPLEKLLHDVDVIQDNWHRRGYLLNLYPAAQLSGRWGARLSDHRP